LFILGFFSPRKFPKNLRHKLVVSDLADLGPGSGFRRVLPEIDPLVPDERVRRIVLCSGKVYYDLLEQRRREGLDDVALVRIEQFYPWPRQSVLETVTRYPRTEVLWCQEEPANMGAWTFVLPRLGNILEELRLEQALPLYAGRPAAASPATGSYKKHVEEQAGLARRALSGESRELPQPFRRVAV
jgi:2-oxoglutarate dehydrogenase E1 component